MTTCAIQHRIRLTVRGVVQGVGFRPFVYRLATGLGLSGGVKNTSQGVVIDIEGAPEIIAQFLHRFQHELPPPAVIHSLKQHTLPAQGSAQFQIWPSQTDGNASVVQILPDLATCSDCLREVFDPHDRRYRYAFTNCTYCGPRFSIVTALPYDRPRTTMVGFSMCPACEAEYANPGDRRFHAQPNACPYCGPVLEFWTQTQRSHQNPLQQAITLLRQGHIVAVKGIGGFQLWVDAQNAVAVERLRQRKRRPDKPLALMYPTLEQVHRDCKVSETAAAALTSAQAPIVLLPKRRQGTQLANAIAPHNSHVGVMLPTTPLHHLLLRQYGTPVVATSGNLSGEPIGTDEQDAYRRLASVADGFLVHNRPIPRPVDDAVVQIVQTQPQVLRHARGYAPQTLFLDAKSTRISRDTCVLALGAHLKTAIALSSADQVVLSQYIGDLDTPQTLERLRQTATDLCTLYRCRPRAIACDLHPDYGSTRLAQTLSQQWSISLIPVQHHYAHVLSGMVEHALSPPVLGVAWDGTGYGLDATVWGGEFLKITNHSFERIAHFQTFPLPGGDACSREPRRSALGLLYACYGGAALTMTDLAPVQTFSRSQRTVLQQMLTRRINTPMTSSVGRLFDGVAALLDLHQRVSFEGQAAIVLESLAVNTLADRVYPFTVSSNPPYAIDWREMVRAIVVDYRQGTDRSLIAARFHHTLVEVIGAIAQRVGIPHVMLTGGCFQNRVLSELVIQRLRDQGLVPYWHQRVPPNDSGIAVGQVLAALRHLSSKGVESCV